MENIQQYVDAFFKTIAENAPSVLVALLTLIIGFWVAGRLTKLTHKAMKKAGVDETIRDFLTSLVSVLFKVLVLIAVAGKLGVETTSFAAILAAAGFAIGMALQGSLGNFASGVLIILFKPYKDGDLVTVGGHTGVVEDIQIFNTVLITPDNKKIFVPNATVTGGPITNISGQGKIRVDMTFGIGYGDDINKARKVIQAVSDRNDLILKDPGTDIFIAEWGASSVNFTVRPWCNSAHYWDVYFYMHEELKKAFDEAGIGIPYDTLDVNIVSNPS